MEDMARRFSLIKTQLTRFEDMAEASRVQPIINIHYLSHAHRKDVLTHERAREHTRRKGKAGGENCERLHQRGNEINTPSLCFVMKCLCCSFI